MVMNDTLAGVLSHINNCEIKGKRECLVKPVSNLIIKVLNILKDNRYIGDFEIVTKARGGEIKINLIGNINKCGVVKPRFSFKVNNYELFEKRYLPAKGFGILLVSTPKGVLIHREALDKKIGGKLLAYCY
ncbi:30S ribosomal protein S8 [Candidatus Woesearchaeota archaeon]|nr:30S ribosomal protein S8 [uncultured archaeon]MBS3175145.1 30S ribosomal protein S8 [Candidatus Woesearchaeota archaeon]